MQEVEIFENNSWSCVHAGLERGVARPLRAALDWLRDTLAGRFEEKAREFLKDTWTARDEYIDVVRDGSPASQSSFLNRHAAHALNDAERVTALNLLELQRHLMLMYTSCGCFFDEISGIERVQVIQYACRAVQLSQEVLGNHVESEFCKPWHRQKATFRNRATAPPSIAKAPARRPSISKGWGLLCHQLAV
jgi:alpha-amylase/alpha-mannosidase (GH57 family)